MRERRRRLKRKAAAAPSSGRGLGTGAAWPRITLSTVAYLPEAGVITSEVNGVPPSSSQPKKLVAEAVTAVRVDAPGLAVTVMRPLATLNKG